MEATLRLVYDKKRAGFKVMNHWHECAFVPAPQNEREQVKEYLARRINDNPSMQALFGLLGVESFQLA